MRNGGLFNSTTESGYGLDVAKSALQKYIRRGESLKAIQAAFELYRMKEVGLTAAVTNLYNRLAIIAVEDIGPANTPLALSVVTYVLSKRRDEAELATIVQLLAESPKTRALSHLWRTYAIKGLVMKEKGEIKPSPFQWLEGDPLVIRQPLEIFKSCLEQRDNRAFYYAFRFLEVSKGLKVIKRYRRSKPQIILWLLLDQPVLMQAYFTLTENRPFLSMAIFLALKGREEGEYNIRELSQAWKECPLLDQLKKGDFVLEVDDYVIDKHTREGRKRGKDRKDFVQEEP